MDDPGSRECPKCCTQIGGLGLSIAFRALDRTMVTMVSARHCIRESPWNNAPRCCKLKPYPMAQTMTPIEGCFFRSHPLCAPATLNPARPLQTLRVRDARHSLSNHTNLIFKAYTSGSKGDPAHRRFGLLLPAAFLTTSFLPKAFSGLHVAATVAPTAYRLTASSHYLVGTPQKATGKWH